MVLSDVYRMSLNAALGKSTKPELVALYALAAKTTPEMALTEFAARLCYNSTAKMGSAQNFVSSVLKHGHLSVAEHASIAVSRKSVPWVGHNVLKINKYFTTTAGLLAGNFRSWFELLSQRDYHEQMELFLAVFPAAFDETPTGNADEFAVAPSLFVPPEQDVTLLAVNLGSFANYGRIKWGRFTFLVENISRATSHQIARHRSASISEQSQRYVAASAPGFTYPADFTAEQIIVLNEHYSNCMKIYNTLRNMGIKKEDARFALPMGINTRMVLSFDYDGLVHFLKMRLAKDAQWQVRNVAKQMFTLAQLATGDDRLWMDVPEQN